MPTAGAVPRSKRIAEADAYLAARTGSYLLRCVRYGAAARKLYELGLSNDSTLVDVGAGWTELDAFLRQAGWRGRYIPVDACIDGVDLDHWTPPRSADFFVALEVIEHLDHPACLLDRLCAAATKGVVLSTPNPETTDVMGMDATHRTPIWAQQLRAQGFEIEKRSFYGQLDDSLFAWWTP